MQKKNSGDVFFGSPGECCQGCAQSWGVHSDNFYNFCGSCYNIQFKPYATRKMELLKRKNR